MGKRPAPFSLRLTFEQRARLERDAGDSSLGAYIQSRLFDEDNPPPRRRGKRPVKDYQALAQVLGLLGQSRLSSNLNQLARAANTGSLAVTPDTEAALWVAVAEIQEIRRILIEALHLEVEP
ncbi:hypothetical protein [Brevundimonas sp.]|uniref:hypothetical protein n=1 Tax=Brevundimonas sp. TaxID=1871086 RepID=UPI002ABAE616|nr:hypothetical protein [Brevundimonas sp.]MDZ4364894.1 hypothetical protein [Brevundimonas sp.]